MNTPRQFGGAGGKSSGGARQAHEDADTISSRSYAHIKDAICEGPILGLSDATHPLRSIYINGTPVENGDGLSFNDGATTNASTNFTTASDHFDVTMVGRGITGTNIPDFTTIKAVVNARRITLSNPASGTGSSLLWGIGGSLNFRNFDFYFLTGTQDQSYVPGFDAQEDTIAVGIRFKGGDLGSDDTGAPLGGNTGLLDVTRTLTDSTIDAVRLDIRFPKLQQQNTSNGDITAPSFSGTAPNIKSNIPRIQIKVNGVVKIDDTIKAEAYSAYTRTYRIDLAGIAAPWTILVHRVTRDAPDQSVRNDTYWDSYTEVTYGKLRHPNTVISAVKIDAEQFSSIPVRAWRIKGLIIKVPANYDPIARTYDATYQNATTIAAGSNGAVLPQSTINVASTTGFAASGTFVLNGQTITYTGLTGTSFTGCTGGTSTLATGQSVVYTHPGVTAQGTWDGSFKAAWSNNPAWCWYDLITSTRYGLGGYIQAGDIDKWALYVIAQYCDGMVSDGFGGTEPRFTCNLYIQARADALQVASDMTSIFRGMVYYSAGLIVAVQDAPASPVAQFAPANVINGKFSYSGVGRRARHNVAVVKWNDLTDMGAEKSEYVEDQDSIVNTGRVNQLNLTGFGCTSRGQAHRIGVWALALESALTDTIVFETGLDGAFVRPGDVISVQDPFRSGQVLSGRLTAATTTLLTLDRSVTLLGGHTYTIAVVDPVTDAVVSTAVTTGAGATSSLAVTALTNAPAVGSVFIIAANDLVPAQYRVLNTIVKSEMIFEITALQYNASVYGKADANLALEIPPTSNLPDVNTVLPPGAVTVTEVDINIATGVRQDLHISWVKSADKFLRGYRVSYRYQNGNWIALEDQASADVILENIKPGHYDISVAAVNVSNRVSAPIQNYAATTLDVPVTLPAGTVTAVSTVGFPVAGSFLMNTSGGAGQVVQYTGKTATQFTGCTGGTGSAGQGNTIAAVLPGFDVLFQTNPLAGATVTGLEMVGLGSATAFVTPDVEFGWRVNSPSWNAEFGGIDPLGLTGRFDPFFQAFVVTIYRANGTSQIQAPVLVTAPRYNFTFEANKRSHDIVSNVDGPFSSFTIGVRILDSFNVLSAEAKFTVTKTAPTVPGNPDATPGLGYATINWDAPTDPSLAKINIYLNFVGSSRKVSVAAVKSGRGTVDFPGLRLGGAYAFFIEAEDVFGLKTSAVLPGSPGNGSFYNILLENPANAPGAGIPISAIMNDIVAPVASPAGGNIPASTNVSVTLLSPTPNVAIYYTTDGTTPTNASTLYSAPFNVNAGNGVTVTVKAISYASGFSGPVGTWAFVGTASSQVIKPGFSPVPGVYWSDDGTYDVTVSTPTAADYMFYTKDGTTPTHDASTPPLATGTAIRVTGASKTFNFPAGITTLNVLGVKSGYTDSAVVTGTYTIKKTTGGTGSGGGGTPP